MRSASKNEQTARSTGKREWPAGSCICHIVKTKVIATGDDKRGRYPEGSATTPSAGKRECVIFVYVFHNIKTKVIAMANEEMM